MVRPKRLSASAIHVAELCMKRYVHMNINFAGAIPNNAAMTGTTVHYALERFVDQVFIQDTHTWDWADLEELLMEGYRDTFQSTDYTTPQYLDALGMAKNWFENADFKGRKVLSVEKKDRYPLDIGGGDIIPVTYIWDRFDVLDDGTYCVVDYKSNQANIGTDELKTKVQAKLYALICQILNPTATKIQVEFHMLRHGVTTVTFTAAESLETWTWLHGTVQRILEAPYDPKPTLNKECGFCMCKTTCPAITDNIANGGVFGLTEAELVDRKGLLDLQVKAAKDASVEIENVLGPILAADYAPEQIEGEDFVAKLSSKSVRNVDTDMFLQVLQSVGDANLVTDYTPAGKVTMAAFDKFLKDTRTSPEARKIMKQLITYITRDPSVEIAKKLT